MTSIHKLKFFGIHRAGVLVFLMCSMFLSACGGNGGGGENTGQGTGAISFSLSVVNEEDPDKRGIHVLAENENQLICSTDGYSIELIDAVVYDLNGNTIEGISGPPWHCEEHHGVIYGIPSGQEYTVVVGALHKTGITLFEGSSDPVYVPADVTADAGMISMKSLMNSPPVMSDIENRHIEEDFLLEFTITAQDPDDDNLTFSIGNKPAGVTFRDNGDRTATFSWRPGYDMAGSYSVIFRATDDSRVYPGSLSDFKEVTFTVGNRNRHPVFDNTLYEGTAPGVPLVSTIFSEGSRIVFSVRGTDPDAEDTLTISTGSLPSGADFIDKGDGTGTLIWEPGLDAAGTYRVLFTIADDGEPVLSAAKEVDITVGDVCRPPSFIPIGSQVANEGELLEFIVTAEDPDPNDILTYQAGNLPEGAEFSDQTFRWTPGFDDTGNYQVIFTVLDQCPDPGPQSDFEEVSITVGDACRPPEIAPIGSKRVTENETLQFTVSAADPDPNETLTFSCASSAGLCNFFSEATQVFQWTPTSEDAGSYEVRFTVCDQCEDPGPLCDEEVVSITVGDACRPPELTPIGSRSISETETLEFSLSAKDPDPGDSLTYSCYSDTVICDYFNEETQMFSWTTSYGDAGNYDMLFRVCDGCQEPGPQCDEEIVTITISDKQLDAPVQISPLNGAEYTHYPRTTTLIWGAVTGAATYTVEIDCYHCCAVEQWCTDVGETWQIVPYVKGTEYTFNFVGDQPGRWRVWAVDATGNDGIKSPWQEFTYGTFKADLVIYSPRFSASPSGVYPGGQVTLPAWTVRNQGDAASGFFSNGFYLSTNAIISSSDIYLTGNANWSLGPGEAFNWGGPTLPIPGNISPGTYYIGILVDRTDSVNESDENNNYVSTPITVYSTSRFVVY